MALSAESGRKSTLTAGKKRGFCQLGRFRAALSVDIGIARRQKARFLPAAWLRFGT
jgi:hypothetical protein